MKLFLDGKQLPTSDDRLNEYRTEARDAIISILELRESMSRSTDIRSILTNISNAVYRAKLFPILTDNECSVLEVQLNLFGALVTIKFTREGELWDIYNDKHFGVRQTQTKLEKPLFLVKQ